jgi:hypothetical protein
VIALLLLEHAASMGEKRNARREETLGPRSRQEDNIKV